MAEISKTVDELEELTTLAASDKLLAWDASETDEKKKLKWISCTNFFAMMDRGNYESVQISSGAVTASRSTFLPFLIWVEVQAETGTADDLDTLTVSGGNKDGDILVVQALIGNTITVKDATGNFQLDGDATLLHGAPKLMCIWRNGTKWDQIAKSEGN